MKRRTAQEEPWLSLRTDGETYADEQLAELATHITLDERQRGYVRDALIRAFGDGECQGECRGLALLGLVQRKTKSPRTLRWLDIAIELLMGTPGA